MGQAERIIGLAAALAIVYLIRFAARDEVSWARTAVKTLSVALLALAAAGSSAPAAIIAGLTLGAVGDFCLSRPGERAFLAGVAAFALGHLAYAAVFLWQSPLPVPHPWPAALALVALGVSTEFWLAPHAGALRGAVRLYVAVILVMALAALTLPSERGLAVAGAGLFVLSDLLLALTGQFQHRR